MQLTQLQSTQLESNQLQLTQLQVYKMNIMFRGVGELDDEASVRILKEKNAYYEEIKDYTMKHTSQ